jgi:hypothetical protein
MVFKCFLGVFFQVFQKHVSSVASVFIRMLQVLHLDVSKENWVLHLSRRFFGCHASMSSPTGVGRASRLPHVGDIRDDAGNLHVKQMGRA